MVNRSPPYVSQAVGAAKVANTVKKFTQVNILIDKAKHLYAIHAADPSLWPVDRITALSPGALRPGS